MHTFQYPLRNKKTSNIDQIESIWAKQLIILIGFDIAQRLVIEFTETESDKRSFNMKTKVWKEPIF